LVAAADHWLEHSGDLSVDILADAADVSRRHLQRRMLDIYGAPPKAIAIKYRALRAASQMATRPTAVLSELLSDYADQPHFTRDFRRFVGMTPGAFLKGGAVIAAGTLLGRYKAGARRPLALWS